MAEVRRDRRGEARLDQPREARRIWLPRLSGDTFGHFAEMFARFMGTARFIAYMTFFVCVWIALNAIGLFGLRWDPYPFILLNLFFSTQASYAAPLILLAQNRQADRDRLTMEEDRRRAAMQKADTEYLAREIASLRIALGEVATRDFIRSELVRVIEELDEAAHRRHKLDRKEIRRAGQRGAERLGEPFDEVDDDLKPDDLKPDDLKPDELEPAELDRNGLPRDRLDPDRRKPDRRDPDRRDPNRRDPNRRDADKQSPRASRG